MNEMTVSIKENATHTRLYHQTTPESAVIIKARGFKRGATVGAGSRGPLRGIFLKETPELLSGARIGNVQFEVALDPNAPILDVTEESPASFVQVPQGKNWRGQQGFALAGWLERSGHQELAQRYQEAVRKMYRGLPENLEAMWPKVESAITQASYQGVRYLDSFIDEPRTHRQFVALAIFDPQAIKVIKE